VNVGGVFLVAREVARHLIARDAPGSIVITSSIAAHHGLPTAPHYSASKGAATALARALAVRLARHRIRVNVLAPGWVETEMTDDMRQNPRFEEALRYRVPLRRWGTASDFEGAAVFLASDASAFMTGAELILDGGYSAF
jgi:NAD(P)-dependent dehydrogenase (short-subunit alcohol dehydrogenase family)